MVVVLPAPLGPRKPKTSPRRTVNETRSTAVNAPKRRVSSSTTTAGSLDGAATVVTPDAVRERGGRPRSSAGPVAPSASSPPPAPNAHLPTRTPTPFSNGALPEPSFRPRHALDEHVLERRGDAPDFAHGEAGRAERRRHAPAVAASGIDGEVKAFAEHRGAPHARDALRDRPGLGRAVHRHREHGRGHGILERL